MIWRFALALHASMAGSGSPQRTHRVEIRGMGFHPAELTVAVGDTVVWINRDIVPHTATADSGWRLDTTPLTQGQTGRYVPTRTGAVAYVCRLHPTMRGKLIVH